MDIASRIHDSQKVPGGGGDTPRRQRLRYAPVYTRERKGTQRFESANRSPAKRAGHAAPGNEEQKYPNQLALIISNFLQLRRRSAETHQVTLHAEPRDLPDRYFGDIGMMPEGFTFVNVRQMNLHGRNADGRDRVAHR